MYLVFTFIIFYLFPQSEGKHCQKGTDLTQTKQVEQL